MMSKSTNITKDYTEKSPLLVLVDNDHEVDNANCVHQRIQAFQDNKSCRPNLDDGKVENDDDNPPRFRFSDLGGEEKRGLILLFVLNIVAGCTLSMLPAFFPPETASRFIPVSATGFVFCVFEIIRSVADYVIIERFVPRFGFRIIYVTGLLLATSGCFIFSTIRFLNRDMQWQFILTSMLCRFVQAVGTSGMVVTSRTIISGSLPTRQIAATALRWVGMGTTVGCMLGPPIGGYLYFIGDFALPFYVLGTLMFISGLSFYLFTSFPQHTSQDIRFGARSQTRTSIFCSTNMSAITHDSSLPIIPSPTSLTTTMFAASSVFTCALVITSLDPILSYYVMRTYGLSIPLVGLLFSIRPAVGAVLTPLWRCLVEDEDIQTPCHVLGLLLVGAGCVLLGPTPILSFIPVQSWTIIVGLVLIGAGTSCVFILAMASLVGGGSSPKDTQECEKGAKNSDSVANDFEDEADSENKIFNGSYLVGVAIGPVLGSILVEFFGFPITSSVLPCFILACMTVYIMGSIMCCFRQKCGWMCSGRNRQDDRKLHIEDCEQCAIRKRDGTFGVFPCQSI